MRKLDEFQIINGDCVVEMQKLPDQSIDMVITSPPYNVGLVYADNDWQDDRLDVSEYKKFADRVMFQVARLLKVGGRACIEIGGSGRNLPLSWIWQDAAFSSGLQLYSEIVIDHRCTNLTAWGSYLKADNVRTIPNFHHLYTFYKESYTKRGKETSIEKDNWVKWTKGRWSINYSEKNPHPASFPVELPARCMKLFGHVGDVILDPFSGSGTTGIACKLHDRIYIGIEKELEYYNLSVQRVFSQPVLLTLGGTTLPAPDAGESAPLQADFFTPAESTSQTLPKPTQRR